MTAARLRMRGVRKRFGATTALDGVDLDVGPGEVLGLVGENGAGKSTLMKILAGALTPDDGTLELDGESYSPSSPVDGRQAGVAMVYQELSLAPHLSVEENLVLGAEPMRGPFVDRRERRRIAKEALTAVGRSSLDPAERVSRLPLGDRQLVEIARAMALGARVLVFDEPTSSLARDDAERLFTLVKKLADPAGEGLAIIYISHFLEEVQELCDRYCVLRDGKTVGEGDPEISTAEEIASAMVGREVEDLYPCSQRVRGEAVLALEALHGKPPLEPATFELHRGEVFGLAGLAGAGRSEIVRAIHALDPVRSGRVTIAGRERNNTPHARWFDGVGMVSEDRKDEGLALSLSIADNVVLPRLDRVSKMPGSHAIERSAGPATLELGVVMRSSRQRVGELSGGNQQKVALARLLFCDVDVLLLDEPTRGIDVGSKAEIYSWIDRLAAGIPEEGRAPKAILIVSSYLPELLGLCDRIAVVCRGRMGTPRPTAEWNEESLMLEATGATQEVSE
ncbi:MAG: sugar ABC transporter ATP-binding protein [Planctomycetota bacterium]